MMGNDCRGAALLRLLLAVLGEISRFYKRQWKRSIKLDEHNKINYFCTN